MPRKTRKQLVGKAAENADELDRELFYRDLRQKMSTRKAHWCQQRQDTSTALCTPIESHPTDFFVNFPLAFL
jgi:hypothetical protein